MRIILSEKRELFKMGTETSQRASLSSSEMWGICFLSQVNSGVLLIGTLNSFGGLSSLECMQMGGS